MKVILWDFTKQADGWLVSQTRWERLEIIYQLSTDYVKDFNHNLTVLSNSAYECILVFADPQISAQVREVALKMGLRNDKLIFALDFNSWLEHFDFAGYLLKPESRWFLFAEFYNSVRKNSVLKYEGGWLCISTRTTIILLWAICILISIILPKKK